MIVRLTAAALITIASAAACGAPVPTQLETPPPERLRAEVVQQRPHDPDAYTEGLELADGRLFESTGIYGESTLREVEPQSGEVLRSVELDDKYFGEGIAVVDDRVIQLTWRERTALVFGLDDFAPNGSFSYETEGWGLCDDGSRLVMSDGTDRLYFRDRSTFAELGSVQVADPDGPVQPLNELECVDGNVYANVYQTANIVRIDPTSGAVTAVIDASSLVPAGDGVGVMNGIAYDPGTETFLLTGKHWPTMYEVKFVPDAAPGPAEGVLFPQHDIGPGEPTMSGLVGGQLVQEGRCILLRTSSGEQYLPIWPPTYALISADPPVIGGVGPGEPPLRMGEEIVLGGGGGAAEVFSSIDPPEECMPNDLWIVAGVT